MRKKDDFAVKKCFLTNLRSSFFLALHILEVLINKFLFLIQVKFFLFCVIHFD